MRIFVANANGKVGQEVVRICRARRLMVKAGGHDITKARISFPNVETVPFDCTDLAGMRRALAEMDVLFSALPYEVLPEGERMVFEAARDSGVKHIVMLSVFNAEKIRAPEHYLGEIAVRNCGVRWTILRPNWFMQNYATYFAQPILEQGTFYEPAGDGKTSFIDTRDIAEAAVQVMTAPGHEERIYELTGGEALDRATVAHHISAIIGTPVQYAPVADADFRAAWASAPPHFLNYLSELYGLVRDGRSATVTNTLRTILGRDPIGIDQFAHDYLSSWHPSHHAGRPGAEPHAVR